MDTIFQPYVLFFCAAVLLGMWITERGSANPTQARRLYLAGIGGGMVGARLWYALQYGNPFVMAGFSYFGFGLGAALGVAALHRLTEGRWASSDFPDAVTPALALGTALHRVGCFITGCCYGTVCSLPWGVRYGPESPAHDHHVAMGWIDADSPLSLPIHPTQLYGTVTGLTVFAILMMLRRRPRWYLRHELLLGSVIFYGVYRFFVEFLRDDAGGVEIGTLTFAQGTSVLVLAAATSVLGYRRFRRRTRQAAEAAKHP